MSRGEEQPVCEESLGSGMVGMKQRGKSLQSQGAGRQLFHLCLSFSLLSQLQSVLPIPTSPSCHLHQYQSHRPSTIPPHPPFPLPVSPRPPLKVSYHPMGKTSPISGLEGGWESISARSVESLTVRYTERREEDQEEEEGGGVYSAHQSSLRSHAAFLTLC